MYRALLYHYVSVFDHFYFHLFFGGTAQQGRLFRKRKILKHFLILDGHTVFLKCFTNQTLLVFFGSQLRS